MSDVRGLDPRFAFSVRLSSVRFTVFSAQEIENISCKRITNPNTFDSLLHPNLGGLYDPALGPCDKHDLCGTCGLNYVHCPGHMGHIPLPLPVYHPVFFGNLYSLLKVSCWNCHKLYCTPIRARILIGQLELIEFGLLSDASTLEVNLALSGVGALDPDKLDKLACASTSTDGILQRIDEYVEQCKSSAGTCLRNRTKNVLESRTCFIMEFIKTCGRGVKKCLHCDAPFRNLRQENRSKMFMKGLSLKKACSWREARVKQMKQRKDARRMTNDDDANSDSSDEDCPAAEVFTKQTYLTPLEVKQHVACLWENQQPLMNAIIGCSVRTRETGDVCEGRGVVATEISPVDVFFLDVVPVPPSRFRPVSCSVC